MKIRTDFVTNSSSSSFMSYRIRKNAVGSNNISTFEDLCKFLNMLIEKYSVTTMCNTYGGHEEWDFSGIRVAFEEIGVTWKTELPSDECYENCPELVEQLKNGEDEPSFEYVTTFDKKHMESMDVIIADMLGEKTWEELRGWSHFRRKISDEELKTLQNLVSLLEPFIEVCEFDGGLD